jgi:ABC-type Fe3+-hydroxamate transport system substrate-binding protein
VVSLVPSITESIIMLGFGGSLSAITDFCIHPKDKVGGMQRVGGTKNPDIAAIQSLNPDIVFVNQEENTEDTVTALLEAGIPLWLSFPKTPDDAIDVLRGILAIYHDDRAAIHVNSLQAALDWAAAAAEDAPMKRYFCPIWMEGKGEAAWWMTFNQDTYADALLSIMGGENIFAERERRYPLDADIAEEEAKSADGRDTRYPRVTVAEIVALDPELILLPSEPFAFDPGHKTEIETLLAFTSAVKNKNVKFVDGSLITWHGVRLGQALQDLPELFF